MPILLMGSWRNHSARGSVPSALAAHTSPIGPMVAVCWPAQRPIWRRENKHLCQMKSCESPWENLMLGSCPLHPRIQYDCCIYIYIYNTIYILLLKSKNPIYIYIYTHGYRQDYLSVACTLNPRHHFACFDPAEQAAPEAYARSITGPRECPEAHRAGLWLLGMEIVSDFGILDITHPWRVDTNSSYQQGCAENM